MRKKDYDYISLNYHHNMLHDNYYFYHYNSLAQPNWEVALLEMMCKLTSPVVKQM